MIRINGYTIDELSIFYNIPSKTIYRWNKYDPENTFKRIINRKIADNKKLKVQRISEIKKQVEKSNKKLRKEELKLNLIILGAFVLILIFLIWVAV